MKNIIGGKLALKGKSGVTPKSLTTDTKAHDNGNKTKSESAISENRKKQIMKKVKRNILMTHREKMSKYNNYLEGLPTNFDIPKIGPG